MLYIEFDKARICINCGTIHDIAIEESYGKDVCPRCGEKMCIMMQAYLNAVTQKEVCHET